MPDTRTIAGRYQVLRILKAGHGAETLLATDLSDGAIVVIKTAAAAAFSATARMRLEHEAAVLERVNAGPSSPLLAHGCVDDQLYLVIPVIPGVTLQARLRQGSLSVTDTLSVGQSLLNSLREAHVRGVLHRDIKPSNVMVDEGTPLSHAALVDFGLMRGANVNAFTRVDWAGTASYLSPEAAGLLDQDVAECSDLYSAGIVLYECLAGHPPFQGNSVGEVLRQHIAVQPPELRSLGLSAPRVLDEIIQRLLRKDPRDRYQSAEAALADLAMIAEALRNGESEPSFVVGLRDRRQTLTEPAFVGRGQELAALDREMERTKAGHGGLALLEAESGGGKTRLLAELALRSSQKGVWVVRGQGLDQAAQRPFQMLTGIAAGLLANFRLEPALAAEIREGLGDHREAVCASLPELAEVLGSTTGGKLGPETFAETRSVQALSALLSALAAAGRPVLALLDDCQWADQLTLKVLNHWQRRQDADGSPRHHVLLVAAFRSEEVSTGHLLRSLRSAAHITLPSFQAADVRRLVESMAGPLPDQAVAVIERLAAGSPFMASAALRGLVESGALLAESAEWRVEPSAMADVQSSRDAAAFLARRVELLPKPSIQLLSVGAVLGKEFDLFTAAKLAQQTSDEAIAAFDEARHRHIVWARVQDSHCVFMHDKLRETLLDRLPEGERRESHLRAALDFEAQTPQRVFELAYHFDAAGESVRALPYAIAAAQQARSQHSLEIAEQQYRIAERGARSADQATRYRIAEGLGDVLMLRGRYAEAALKIEAARELAEGDVAKARIEGKLSELAFKRGDVKTATEANERALELLGHKVPQWSAGFFFRLAREAFTQVLHTMLPGFFLARKKLQDAEKQLLTVRLYNRLAYCYWFGKGRIPCLWAHLRGMNLGEQYPPTLELAFAYSSHAPVMSLVPSFSRGIAYTQKSFAICKSLEDLWGQGQALHFNGLVLSVASRYEECIEKCREAVRLMERTGDVWEVNIAHYHIANSLFRLGDLPAAVAEAKRIHQSGLELGDIQATGICLHVWVQASGGQVSPETVRIELQRDRADVQVGAQVMLAEGVRLFMLDRVEEAAAVFEKGHQLTERTGVKNNWTFPLLSWLASALRRQAEKASHWAPDRRHALLKRAGDTVGRALKIARVFQNELPHALREAGLVAAMRGSPRRARAFLDESLAAANRQGAKFEHAQTLLARGRVGLETGWPDAQQDIEAARQALHALGADFILGETALDGVPDEPATLSLVDRFDTVLDTGRKIASALSRHTILDEVREAALRLLRGERCLLLRFEGDDDAGELVSLSGAIEAETCRDLAQRTLESGRVLVDGQTDSAGKTVLLAGVRSVLCAPVFVRGQPAGCFYVDHRHVSGLFGEDEKHLAEFIAAIAGAALENAEGFAALRRLNETLEERVVERTAAVEARAKDLARSNADLEQFAYIASHDLQEPLRKVQTFGDLLTAEAGAALNATSRLYVERMRDAARRMQALINDLLSFARVTSQAKVFVEVDLARVAREVVSDLAGRLKATAGRVEIGELPRLQADPTQMRQLLQNLIGNGLKFHRPDAQPVVVVRSRCLDDGGGALHPPNGLVREIIVQDNGIGFEEKYLDRIFTPFQRLHGHGQYEGTGMGLAICRKIVERHGGAITARSELGKGSAFIVTLPSRQQKEEPPHA